MRKAPNKLWALGPPLSLALLAFAYYVKMPSFREKVDRHFPWAREYLGQFVTEPKVVLVKDRAVSTAHPEGASKENEAAPPALGEKRNGRSPGDAKNGAASKDEPLTMEKFAATPSLWPKTVRLLTKVEFPAVTNGKKVGTIQAPAGTEASLRMIHGQILGVEYQGGGAWVPISATDLLDQVKITGH